MRGADSFDTFPWQILLQSLDPSVTDSLGRTAASYAAEAGRVRLHCDRFCFPFTQRFSM